jgi:hypothetical protein
MRILVIKQSIDLNNLSKLLLKTPSAEAGSSALDRVRALNPHVDFHHINAGTVLFVPDLPTVHPGDSRSVGHDTFAEFSSEIAGGLKAAVQRARSGLDLLSADQLDVQSALKTPVVKRAVAGDPLLKEQLAAVEKQVSSDQKETEDAIKAVEQLQKAAAEELANLAKVWS